MRFEPRNDLVRFSRGIYHEETVGKAGTIIFINQVTKAEIEVELARERSMLPRCLLAFGRCGDIIAHAFEHHLDRTVWSFDMI